MTPRLERRLRRDFPDDPEVVRLVEAVHATERVQAAVVLGAAGDEQRLRDAIAVARLDWRDILVYEGLADDGWPAVLDRVLGTDQEEGGRRHLWRRR